MTLIKASIELGLAYSSKVQFISIMAVYRLECRHGAGEAESSTSGSVGSQETEFLTGQSSSIYVTSKLRLHSHIFLTKPHFLQ